MPKKTHIDFQAYKAVKQYLKSAKLAGPPGLWIRLQVKAVVQRYVDEGNQTGVTYLIPLPGGQAVQTEVCTTATGYQVLMTDIV